MILKKYLKRWEIRGMKFKFSSYDAKNTVRLLQWQRLGDWIASRVFRAVHR